MLAQIPDGGGLDLGAPAAPAAQPQQVDTGTDGFGGGTGTGGGTGGDGGLAPLSADDADLLSGIGNEDVRNQGFVGVTGTRIQDQGFVGPPGENSGPPLTDGASFGGGVNDSAGGGGGGGGNFGNNRQNGFGGFGQQKGFQVIRRGVRTRFSPRFDAPTISNGEITTRFNNRIARQPIMAGNGGGLFVSVNNRVATVSGFAQTAAERERFVRQLRLEPGIDRVIDQAGQ